VEWTRQSRAQGISGFLDGLREMASILREAEGGGDLIERGKAEVYEATKALGDYCVQTEVQHIVLADVSARPVWAALYKYLSLAHPDTKKPAVHFFSPKLLSPRLKGSLLGTFATKVAHRLAAKQLVQSRNSLLDHKDESVLIFDTCMHSGETVEGYATFLKKQGFSDLRTGTFTLTNISDCLIRPDFCYTYDFKLFACRPYGLDTGFDKPVDKLYVAPPQSETAFARIANRRQKYNQIIAEQYALRHPQSE
jgi:hypothetical protein